MASTCGSSAVTMLLDAGAAPLLHDKMAEELLKDEESTRLATGTGLASKKKSKKVKKGKPATVASSSAAPASGSREQTEPREDEAAALLQAHEAKLRSAIESGSLSVLDQAIRMAPHEANAGSVGAEARALRDKLVEVGLAAEQKARREAAKEAAQLAARVGSLDVSAGVPGTAVVAEAAAPLVRASEVAVSLSELCGLTSDFEESHKVCHTSTVACTRLQRNAPATHGRWVREDSAASSRPPVSVASRP